MEIEFSETPDLATAQVSVEVVGQSLTWAPCRDGYGLCCEEALPAGDYELQIDTGLQDLAGTPLPENLSITLNLQSSLDDLAYQKPDPSSIDSSSVGQPYGFHGLPLDPETGLIYARNRYDDPELGRFIQPDPMGYVDGPNLYQYGLNSPLNYGDPMGLEVYLIYRPFNSFVLGKLFPDWGISPGIRRTGITAPREMAGPCQ